MRKILLSIGLLVALAVVVALVILPGITERSLNKTQSVTLPEPSAKARALHGALFVADLHADTLLWQRSVLKHASRGHVDLPRLQQGGVGLQVFGSVTQSPKGLNYDRNSSDSDTLTLLAIAQRQPIKTWGSLLERSLWHAERLKKAQADSNGELRLITTASELVKLQGDRAAGAKVTGAMLGVEGLHNLEGDIANLKRIFDAGYRMAGLTHFFDNELGGSMHGIDKGGLTPMGRAVVVQMQSMGMAVDIAHLSPQAIDEVLAISTKPIFVSHTGVQALCKVNRNLTDAQISGVAATGGVIGIGYWHGAVCGVTPQAIAKSMRRVRDLVGIEHVALGSDFDGAVTTGFDTSALVQITHALLLEGFSDDEVRLAMGGNVVRVLAQTLPP